MVRPAHIEWVPIPEALRAILLAHFGEQKITAWAIEALVVEAAREHLISRRKAASLLGFKSYVARQNFFERHGLTNEYTLEMFEQDLDAIASLRARP